MITESKKIEFWNFLTTEKNQPRPKGITVHRLAVLKPAILSSEELWREIIEDSGAANHTAAEYYHSEEASSIDSRAVFWHAVRKLMTENENKDGRRQMSKPARTADQARPKSVSRNGRRKRF